MTDGGFKALISIGNFILAVLVEMYDQLFVTPFDDYLVSLVAKLGDLFPSVISDVLTEVFRIAIDHLGVAYMNLPAGFVVLILIAEICIALAFFKWIMSFVRLFKSI